MLRVWVASVDSSRDVLIGRNILAQTFDGFRKIRNTARFLLGNLADQPREDFALEQLSLVRRVFPLTCARLTINSCSLSDTYSTSFTSSTRPLARPSPLTSSTKASLPSFVWSAIASDQDLVSTAYQALSAFSNTTLSSFYFEITKDTLYADSSSTLFRRKTLFVLQKVFDTYLSVLAPIAPLLAEEIHHFARRAVEDPKVEETGAGSVFEKGWPEAVSAVRDLA